ncbi:cadmium-translocating P-type ATPase, partial [Desulfovibrio sp. OttesenSCG-928-C14]|nr:cadmium-translocating P-type ATPase [Desulfovibrio sp. OttesenSCG-928-C14]
MHMNAHNEQFTPRIILPGSGQEPAPCPKGSGTDGSGTENGAHGCSCCAPKPLNLASQSEADLQAAKKLNPEQKKDLAVLIASAVLFALALIFEDGIQSALGIWGVRAFYAVPYLLCGIPVFKNAFRELSGGFSLGGLFNEFSLMGLATLAAIALGHLSEAVGVMLFYQAGEFLQDLASSGSRRSIKSLLASRPDRAFVLEGENVVETPVEEVQPGARLLVKAGEKIPLDGVVISGSSSLDQSPLTGESLPVEAREGTPVLAGSINKGAALVIEASGRFADTHMARILEMVENAAARKSPTERFITRFARYYTPAVVLAAALLAVLPPLLGPAPFAESFPGWLYRALVLLVISCPCALLISIPLGYFAGIGNASRQGILVKGGNVLDGVLRVKTVFFDKTGTLTKGVFSVSSLNPAPGVSESSLLRAAALAESASSHPLARAVLEKAASFTLPANLRTLDLPGKGVSAFLDGNSYLAGTAALFAEHGIEAPEVHGSHGVIHVAENSRYLGHILVSDQPKPDAAEALAALRALGLKTVILSGDRAEAVDRVASALKSDDYRAELLPEQKVAAMEEMADPAEALFVGDGINDAPALAISRVGVAMGGIGSAAAMEAADAVIINDSPTKVAALCQIARRVKTIVWQNIGLALGIKGLFMALGVAGLSGLWEAVFADVGVALLA